MARREPAQRTLPSRTLPPGCSARSQMRSASTSPAATISRSLLRHIAPGSSSGTAPSWVRRRMRTGALFRATCCAKPGLRTEDVSADDLDLDCSAAATDVLNRARDEELLIASLESPLK